MEQQIACVVDVGWNSQSGAPADATPEKIPDEAQNFFIDFSVLKAFRAVAKAPVTALAGNLRAPHEDFWNTTCSTRMEAHSRYRSLDSSAQIGHCRMTRRAHCRSAS